MRSIPFLLFVSVFIPVTATFAQDKEWHFPWPKNYIKLDANLDSDDIDGYRATRLWITGGDNFKMGGALSSVWSITSGKNQSLKVRMLYRPDVSTKFYLYAKPASIPMGDAKSFRNYVNRIVKMAEKDKSFEMQFDQNEDEELRIYPKIPERSLARFEASGREMTNAVLKRLRPKLFGNPYYQLRYNTVRDDKPTKGVLVFADIDDWVLCYELEANADQFEYPEKSLRELLLNLYVEDRYVEEKQQIVEQASKDEAIPTQ